LSQLLSKVAVASCSFYIKMLNVSALLLDDAHGDLGHDYSVTPYLNQK